MSSGRLTFFGLMALLLLDWTRGSDSASSSTRGSATRAPWSVERRGTERTCDLDRRKRCPSGELLGCHMEDPTSDLLAWATRHDLESTVGAEATKVAVYNFVDLCSSFATCRGVRPPEGMDPRWRPQ